MENNEEKSLRIINLNKSRSGNEEGLKEKLNNIEDKLSEICKELKLDFLIGKHTGPKNEAFLLFNGPLFDSYKNNPLTKLDKSREVLIELSHFVNKIIMKNKQESHVEYTSLSEIEMLVEKFEALNAENNILKEIIKNYEESSKKEKSK